MGEDIKIFLTNLHSMSKCHHQNNGCQIYSVLFETFPSEECEYIIKKIEEKFCKEDYKNCPQYKKEESHVDDVLDLFKEIKKKYEKI
jgi:hypothetical protein